MNHTLPSIYILFQRNIIYYRRARGAQKQFLLLLLMLITFVVLIFNVSLYSIPPIYFLTGPDGKKLRNIPLTEPYAQDKVIKDIASLTIEYLTTYNYSTYNKVFSNIQQYLPITSNAMSEFRAGFNYADNLRRIQLSQMSLIGKIGQVTIVKRGLYEGRFVWDVHVPVKQLLISGNTPLAYEISSIWTVRIARFPINGFYKQGVGVFQLTSERVSK